MTFMLKNKKRKREWEAFFYEKKSEFYIALRVMVFGTFMKFVNFVIFIIVAFL